jgi:hypothetical protein
MFSSVGCWEIPQARTAARAELGPLMGSKAPFLALDRSPPVFPDQRAFREKSACRKGANSRQNECSRMTASELSLQLH